MEKKVEIQQAKKRRAKLLAAFVKSGYTQAKFATKHGISTQRMGWLLRKAKIEANIK